MIPIEEDDDDDDIDEWEKYCLLEGKLYNNLNSMIIDKYQDDHNFFYMIENDMSEPIINKASHDLENKNQCDISQSLLNMKNESSDSKNFHSSLTENDFEQDHNKSIDNVTNGKKNYNKIPTTKRNCSAINKGTDFKESNEKNEQDQRMKAKQKTLKKKASVKRKKNNIISFLPNNCFKSANDLRIFLDNIIKPHRKLSKKNLIFLYEEIKKNYGVPPLSRDSKRKRTDLLQQFWELGNECFLFLQSNSSYYQRLLSKKL